MRVAIYISSITGNTRSIAEHTARALTLAGHSVECFDSHTVTRPADADLHIVAFWCRRQSMDDLSLRIAQLLPHSKTIAIGTMGSRPNSDYGRGVLRNVQSLVTSAFVCRGRIDPARTRARRALPPDHPHYLNDDGYLRHLESRTHPDENDYIAVSQFVLKCINEVE